MRVLPFRRRILLIVIAATLALLSAASIASAHAILLRTDPVDGAVLAEAPAQVRLWFTEPVLLNLTTVELIDGAGQHVAPTRVTADASDPNALVVDLPKLSPNIFRVTWQAVASDDLHVTYGSIVFGVQHATDGLEHASEVVLPRPEEVTLRWLNFAALSGLFGALALAFLVLPIPVFRRIVPPAYSSNEVSQSPLLITSLKRLLGFAFLANLLALPIGFGLLLVQASAVGTVSGLRATLANAWQIVTQTDYGFRWLMHETQLLVLAGVIVFALRRVREIRRLDAQHEDILRETLWAARFASIPLILALTVTQAQVGHAAGLDNSTALGVIFDALHFLAAGIWAGGLLAFAIVVVPLLRTSVEGIVLARVMLRRFGIVAAISVAVLAITGLYAAGQLVASLDALLFTLYGQSLLVKIGLVLVVGLLGLFNSAALHPRVGNIVCRIVRRSPKWVASRHLERSILFEAIGAVAVLLFAAVLGTAPPALGPEFDPPAIEQAAPLPVTQDREDLVLTLSVKPDRPGQNFVSLGVFNTRRPAPAPIERVALRLTPPGGQRDPIELEAVQQGEGSYQVGSNIIDTSGDWHISVVVSRKGMPDVLLTTPWKVLPAAQTPPPRAVVISNRPLAPWLAMAALIIALILIGLLIALRVRRLLSGTWRLRSLVAGRLSHAHRKE